MNVAIYDHKTLGKDKMLGEGDVDVRVTVNAGSSLTGCHFRSGGTFNHPAWNLSRLSTLSLSYVKVQARSS